MGIGTWKIEIGKTIISSFLFFIFYFSFLTSHFLFPIAEGATVAEIEIKGLHSIEKKELLNLLDISIGKTIDRESIQRGIKRAFLKGIFEDISFEVSGEEKAKVTIMVRERDFIEKVYVEGEHGLSKRMVETAFPLKEDHVMRYDRLNDAIEKLRAEMALRGYPHAMITAEVKRLKKPYRVDIRLTITAGEPETIQKIMVSVETERITPEEIKGMMKLSEGDIYDQVKVREDLERIKSHLKKSGYLKPVVGPYTFADHILCLSVNPGKRLEIMIKGNDALSTRTLMKAMPFFEAEEVNDDVVDEARYRMLSLYHERGYPFAQFATAWKSQDDLISVEFFIYEGEKVKLGKILFNGVSLPEKNLKEVMSLKEGNPFNTDLIETDRDALQAFYNALGYLTAYVEELQTRYNKSDRKMDIKIRINEGPKTEIERIDIVGTHLIAEEEVRRTIGIQPGDFYNEVDISDARYRVIDLYNTHGLSGAAVSVRRTFEGQKAFLTFQIKEGEMIFLGKTIITGNDDTKYRVIERELLHREGMPFDYRLLSKDRQKLHKLGLFTDVDVEVLETYDNQKDVLIKLKEGRAGAIEFGVGYGDYEGPRGFIDFSYRNLWGMNRQASLRFELSSLEKRLLLQYFEPWFLDTHTSFRAFFLREEREERDIDTKETRYRLRRHAASAGLEKRVSEKFKAQLYYEFSLNETFDVQPDVVLSREDMGTIIISGIRPALIYDTRDNPFDPKKGFLSGVSVKFTSPLFFSESNFVKVTLQGSNYHSLTKWLVLAVSLRGGIAEGHHGTNELPIVERFFLGGRTTVRGYDQDTLGPKGADGNPTGGNAFLCGNLELRTYLGKGIGFVTFLDGGNVWLKTNDINLGDIKYSVGLGLRYSTPVGPLTVDYGHKLDREPRESRGEFHFYIGHAF